MSELRPYPKPSYPQRVKTAAHYLLPQLAVTRAAGWLADRRWGVLTTLAVKTFAACYKIDLAEAEKSRAGDYASFNEFFIRTLKPGARPIDANPDTLCLPADGRVSEAGAIENGRLIQAKGHSFTTLELLAGDETLAAQFSDGLFLTTYLSPRDYHRVHMPCAATLRRMVYVPGELYSVNPFLARHIPNLFARNERLICVFDTAFGSMVQILVGATVTASISTTWAGIINPPRPPSCNGSTPPKARTPSNSKKDRKWARSASAPPSSTSSRTTASASPTPCAPARKPVWAGCSASGCRPSENAARQTRKQQKAV